MTIRLGGLILGLLCGTVWAASPDAGDCARLGTMRLPSTEITLAQIVEAGKFVPPGSPPSGRASEIYKRTPAFCRVVAHAHPTSDSNIEIEVWMPMAHWNGKFQGEGNGGFAGSIGYDHLAAAVTSGYASAGTDTGHKADGLDARWALDHPEKVIDFGYRAVHEMATQAKAIIRQFYATEPGKSYFVACSDGGREALMEAQRFPTDFDGILAGAPANYWTHLLTAGDDLARIGDQPQSAIPDTKIPTISRAVLAACDDLDGVKDGVVSDPRRCHFAPETIECKGPDSSACLTSSQVALLKRLYAGGKTESGQQIFPGYLPGGEQGDGGWKNWILGSGDPAHSTGMGFVNGYFRYMVYNDPGWKPGTHPVEADLQMAEEKTARPLDSVNPDLSEFGNRGGKLIIYHGWNDPAISALNSINYYEAVNSRIGSASATRFLRLYLVPGMQHCIGGPGPHYFGQFSVLPQEDANHSLYLSLERWVEAGQPPGTIIANKPSEGGNPRMSRPICPYPAIAKYKGSGDTNSAENFVCAQE